MVAKLHGDFLIDRVVDTVAVEIGRISSVSLE